MVWYGVEVFEVNCSYLVVISVFEVGECVCCVC